MNMLLQIFSIILLLLSGCGLHRSPIPTYYILHPSMNITQLPISKHDITGPIVAIDTITIPAYLDQPQIFIREGEATIVQFAEFHRWSESLAEGINRILQQSISNILTPINGLAVGPNSMIKPDWILTVNIFQFDGAPNNEVILDAIWTLSSNTHKISHTGRFTKRLMTGPSIADMVITQGILLEQLGTFIGDEIRSHLPYELLKE